jgi:hypothetical protein
MKKEVVNELQKVTEDLIGILSPLTEQQLNIIPFSQSWTAGQVGDHLLKSYSSWTIFSGTTVIANRSIDEFCKPLCEFFLNFDIKLTAEPSDFNYPTNDYIKRETLLTNIRTTTEDIINFSNQNELEVLCLDFEFPTFGHLTRFEWLCFHKTHTQRHIRQLINIINHLKTI